MADVNLTNDCELEFEIRPLGTTKRAVYQRRVGCVYIGLVTDCETYVRQARAKAAVKAAEKALTFVMKRRHA